MYRVVFFGTESFAVKILESLLAARDNFSVVAVVTQPARPVGRKQIITHSPVHTLASAQGLPVLTPEKLRGEEILEQLKNLNADVFVVAQYGLIIPKSILAIPPNGAVNVHGSLLPRHRGASPVHAAILSGDTVTGTTFMKMDELMDHGDLFASYPITINPKETTETLMARLAELSATHFPSDLKDFLDGSTQAHPQNHADATATGLLSRESGFINWQTMDAHAIERMIRALSPWPGVTAHIETIPYKLIAAHVENGEAISPNPGLVRIEGKKIILETILGDLVVDQIQPAGKQPMQAADFINGNAMINGKVCATESASSK